MLAELQYGVAARTGARLLRGLLASTEIQVSGSEDYDRLAAAGSPVIFVLWHGRMLPPVYRHRNEGIVALVSRSGDGEYLARLLRRWGYRTARGSSSRGGRTALRELVRHARAGASLAITPDGPRGPKQKMKLGPLVAAQLTGLPLIPLAAGANRAWWLEGWDRFLIPKPFARIHLRYGGAFEVPREASSGQLARLARDLEATLDRLVVEADERANSG